MHPAESERVPVVVLNVFQLLCPVAIFGAAAAQLPAVEIDLWGGVTQTLFDAFGGLRVLIATVVCAVLGVAQTAAIRDPARGTRRYRFGIVLAVAAVVAGLVVAHASYRVGFVPIVEELDSRPRVGAYLGVFGGAGFAALGIVRLTRFFEPQPPVPAPPAETH
jgi:hypothetical protein